VWGLELGPALSAAHHSHHGKRMAKKAEGERSRTAVRRRRGNRSRKRERVRLP
jgi:hypothetical protein